jgi:hypothetical protein
MTIRDNILAVKKRILTEIDEPQKPFTTEVQDKGIAAILHGIDSEECRTYMELFALPDKPQQLQRLMGEDDMANDPGVRRARAYLMSAAPCGSGTVLNFDKGITNALDEGLQD